MQKRKFVKVPMHEIIVNEAKFLEDDVLYVVARSRIWGHLSKKGRFIIKYKIEVNDDQIVFLSAIEANKMDNGKPPIPSDRLSEIVERIAKKVKKAQPELFEKWLTDDVTLFKWQRQDYKGNQGIS